MPGYDAANLMVLAAEASNWDKTAAVAAVIGTLVVIGAATLQFLAWVRRGRNLVQLTLEDLEIRNRPGGEMEVVWRADVLADTLVGARCWFQQDRMVFPLVLKTNAPHLMRPGCTVYTFTITDTYAPLPGQAILWAEIRLWNGATKRNKAPVLIFRDG